MAKKDKYNILVLMTDQQRTVQHFPTDWVAKYLTNLNKLQENGITFQNAITNTCRCSPVRGMTWTSTYPPRNGVEKVGGELTSDIATLGYIMAYGKRAHFPPPPFTGEQITTPGPHFDVVFNGKWHLGGSEFDNFSQESDALTQIQTRAAENATMQHSHGMGNWDSPDAGTSLSSPNTTGGAPDSTNYRWQNDIRYAGDVIDFIANYDGKRNFFLVASLVNPHDIWAINQLDTLQEVFPDYYHYVIDPQSTPPPTASREKEAFFKDLKEAFNPNSGVIQEWLNEGNFNDDLLKKPSVHTFVRDNNNPVYQTPPGTNLSPEDYAVSYLRFYAYLNYLADQLHGQIYQALADHSENLLKNTIVLRIADHGETGCSHNGMEEKDYNMYNETIRVPVIFSNPDLWPNPVVSDAMIGLVDLVPTLMQFAGLKPNSRKYQNSANAAAPNAGEVVSMFQGKSWYKYLTKPKKTAPPRSISLFTYDDTEGSENWHIRGIVVAPGEHEAVVTNAEGATETVTVHLSDYYKYGVYYFVQDGGAINYEPYDADSNPNGLQYECYQDYTGDRDAKNAGETNNIFFTEWGKSWADWTELHRSLHLLLTSEMAAADLCGPGNLYNPVTPASWLSTLE